MKHKDAELTRRVTITASIEVESKNLKNAQLLVESELTEIFGNTSPAFSEASGNGKTSLRLTAVATVSGKSEDSEVYAKFAKALTESPGSSVLRVGNNPRKMIVQVTAG